MDWSLPRLRPRAFTVWTRNYLVWRKLMAPAILFHFGEPLLYLLGLGYGLGTFVGDVGGMPYLSFVAAGFVASSAMTTASFEGTYSVFTRMVPQQTYGAILTTPVGVDDILAGEFLWCASKATLASTAILIVATALGAVESWQALWVLPVVFLCGLCFAGPSIVMATLAPSYDFFNYYFTLLITPMFILCGVFYPISTLPEVLQSAVQVLPLTHAIALVRPLTTGGQVSDVGMHLAVLAAYAAAGYYLAVVMVRRRMFV